jgi:hypothetical protein
VSVSAPSLLILKHDELTNISSDTGDSPRSKATYWQVSRVYNSGLWYRDDAHCDGERVPLSTCTKVYFFLPAYLTWILIVDESRFFLGVTEYTVGPGFSLIIAMLRLSSRSGTQYGTHPPA